MSGYKDTLTLPQTDFPMKAGLAAREPAMLERWESEGLYAKIQAARADSPLFVLHDGPPFANGDVHMGTALNKVLKDLVIKSRSMEGFRAPFVPGWDCHGLPIEFKVVQEARDLEPAEIRRRSEAYARRFIDTQRAQFRSLGVLGDWENPYLTLDPIYEAEIVRGFARFVEAGLVYRSKKPVHWSTGAQTALAEAEVEYQEKTSPAVAVRFALEADAGFPEGTSIAIWTTTPWTLPANLAIAVHPRHSYALVDFGSAGRLIVAEALVARVREMAGADNAAIIEVFPGSRLEGVRARHPFLERCAVVYPAEFVTLDAGTGCVHIAPGHGEDDYLLGMTHGMELLSPVDDAGCFTSECGVDELVGRNVFAANARIVEMLAERGALVSEEAHVHSYPHCWRSKTPVIFRAIEQFFIRIDDLRQKALVAIDATQWLPAWGRTRIRDTVASRPDWCISRQRVWGVPLPVFYDAQGAPILDAGVVNGVADIFSREGTNAWFEKSDAEWAAALGLPEGTTRKNDTLDVWIDSGMSHEAVLRKHPGLAFPADLYIEATDQHRGWFQSSLMTSVALNGKAPYRAVLTHGFVVDVDTRKKISKSAQGGYKKPMTADHFVKQYGADLVRLWVASVNHVDDVPFSDEIFKRLTDTYRRIRNTLRILLANGGPQRDEPTLPEGQVPLVDRWLLDRLDALTATCRAAYASTEFHKVYRALNDFCAVELSSLYVDITKDRLYCDAPDSPRKLATEAVMRAAFDTLCRLLAPILVFTADEAWGHFSNGNSVHLELFPPERPEWRDPRGRALMDEILAARAVAAQAVETARKEGVIAGTLEARITLVLPAGPLRSFADNNLPELEEILIASQLVIEEGAGLSARVEKIEGPRCERCWRHRPEVGIPGGHPELCSRCAQVVERVRASRPS
jgi:isoleucyl-tRNA synthetase